MKSWAFLLLSSLLTAGIISCGNNSTETTNTDSTITTGSDTAMTTTTDATSSITVPDNTRTAFETKYTGASNVRWTRQNRDAALTSTAPDSMDYQVQYRWNDMDYTTWYEYDGDWIVTTAKVPSDKLPAAVNNAISSKYPGYTVTEVDMENDKNMTSYEVDLEKGTEKKTIHFSESGQELKKKEKTK